MFFTVNLLNSAPAAAKLQLLLFPVIPVLLGVLVLIVISVVAYIWLKRNPINLK
jgi:hypothetical protein